MDKSKTIALKVLLAAFLIGGIVCNIDNTSAENGNFGFSATVEPSILISIPTAPVSLNVRPSSGGTTGSSSVPITVYANSANGYTLNMGVSSTDLISLDNDVIPTLEDDNSGSGYPLNSITANHWGFSVDQGNYFPATSGSKSIKATNVATGADGDATSVSLGTRLNLETVPGSYATTLNFVVIANRPPMTINDLTNLQDFSILSDTDEASVLESMVTGQAYALSDNRDQETYYIAKLADGHVWMLDNLRLDLTNSDTLDGLTTINTNADAAALLSLKSENRTNGNQYAAGGFAAWDSNNTTSVYNIPKANADSKNTVAANYGSGSGKVGLYYNYCAASAGSYCYNKNTLSEDPVPDTAIDSTSDICPAGWRMPTGGAIDANTGAGEYQNLYSYYNNVADFRTALSLSFAGVFADGSVSDNGTYGGFWTTTYQGSNNMYYLNVSSSEANSQLDADRINGLSVRCLH